MPAFSQAQTSADTALFGMQVTKVCDILFTSTILPIITLVFSLSAIKVKLRYSTLIALVVGLVWTVTSFLCAAILPFLSSRAFVGSISQKVGLVMWKLSMMTIAISISFIHVKKLPLKPKQLVILNKYSVLLTFMCISSITSTALWILAACSSGADSFSSDPQALYVSFVNDLGNSLFVGFNASVVMFLLSISGIRSNDWHVNDLESNTVISSDSKAFKIDFDESKVDNPEYARFQTTATCDSGLARFSFTPSIKSPSLAHLSMNQNRKRVVASDLDNDFKKALRNIDEFREQQRLEDADTDDNVCVLPKLPPRIVFRDLNIQAVYENVVHDASLGCIPGTFPTAIEFEKFDDSDRYGYNCLFWGII